MIHCLITCVVLFSSIRECDPSDLSRFISIRQTEMDSCKLIQEKGMREQITGFRNYSALNESEFGEWKKRELNQYQRFREEIEAAWGEYHESSKKRYVHYESENTVVDLIDYERGLVTVEALNKRDETDDILRDRLKKAVMNLLTGKDENRNTIPEQPVVGDFIADETGKKKIDSSEVSRYAERVILQAKTVETAAGKEKMTLTFPMVSDHVRIRALKYQPIIRTYCQKYTLDEALVMATIHTESAFNPMARSQSNALGLMQIVPESGGREAYLFVYGQDKIPLPEMLYNPEQNIELGCAYLFLLKTRYFGAVLHQTSNLYCSIAGYNTGPGNVAVAFTGNRIIHEAVRVINKFKKPEEVYTQLIESLPYHETRIYLKNVIGAMLLYK